MTDIQATGSEEIMCRSNGFDAAVMIASGVGMLCLKRRRPVPGEGVKVHGFYLSVCNVEVTKKTCHAIYVSLDNGVKVVISRDFEVRSYVTSLG